MTKIAVIRRNGLGDLLCAYPLLLYLRQQNPSAHLTLFVDKSNAALVPFLSPVNEVVVFPSKGNKYWNMFRIARRYRKKFQIAVSAKTTPMKLMNFLLFCLHAEKRVAYVDPEKWHSRAVNVPKVVIQGHQALKTLKLIDPTFTTIPKEFYPKAHVSQSLKEKYPLSLPDKPLLCISASNNRVASRLSIERHHLFLNQLKGDFHVVIVGQKEDLERARALAKGLHASNSVHIPQNFEEFMVTLDACSLFFVCDGGVAHLGAALGKEQVVLYGCTDLQEWAPLTDKAALFYHPHHVDAIPEKEIQAALNQKLANITHSSATRSAR